MAVNREVRFTGFLLIMAFALVPCAMYAATYEQKSQQLGQTIIKTHYYPSAYNLLGSTTNVSGSIDNLASNNGVYMQFGSYPSKYETTTFGQTSVGSSSVGASGYARGTIYTCTATGTANSITAYLEYSPAPTDLGNNGTGTSYSTSIVNTIVGQRIQTPSSQVIVQSISAYIYCSLYSKNMKAAIYDNSGNLVATTNQISVPTGTASRTFTFASPPTLTASTYYVIVVWSAAGSGGSATLYASSTFGGYGRYTSATYGAWPTSVTFSTNTYNYEIYCTYIVPARTQCAIYNSAGTSRLGTTNEVTLNTGTDWVTFPFTTKPTVSASTQYILAIMTDSSEVSIYYSSSSNTYYRTAATYPTWPSSMTPFTTSSISIYCTVQYASEYTCEVEFTGSSNTQSSIQIDWTVDSSWTAGSVSVTLQLYNYQTGQYPTSGDGYISYTSSSTPNTDETKTATITINPTYFRDASGNWQLKIKGVKATSSQFNCLADLCEYKSKR